MVNGMISAYWNALTIAGFDIPLYQEQIIHYRNITLEVVATIFQKWWTSFWMLINPYFKNNVKLGNQPIKKWWFDFQGFLHGGCATAMKPKDEVQGGPPPSF